ncbi:MAG TPA: PEP/pyruvate-binding domain-containing protein [Phycisphaerae bacterium]|nr:PEP/pyruvate-binding domain-containing protein [Phycisphaerae bacterium]HNU46073.1 PEP/pyruvate-binding domain-containing protein [Phycisphaerae bacterium]
MPDVAGNPGMADLELSGTEFQNLMPYRVEDLLVVSSLYESFILEEDGLLTELITSEYMNLNLTHAPRVRRASTEREALEVLRREPVDLAIVMPRVGQWKVGEFARSAKRLRPGLPVMVLSLEPLEPGGQAWAEARTGADRIFVWNGDPRILLAIIKFAEDQLNVEHDTRHGDVRVIILVENSVRFYSAYLPLIYTEIMKLTQALMAEEINVMHRLLRMRARPKILLAETFEEAWELYTRYQEYVLGVISDIRFPREGQLADEAGLEFARRVKECSPHMPVLLQSSDGQYARRATQLQAGFLNKRSPHLLQDMRDFLLENLGFGDFVFRLPDGTEVARAHDLRSFTGALASIPEPALDFHARLNHFSNWLMARTEFELAAHIRPRRIDEFPSLSAVREYLLKTISESRERHRSGVIADFSPAQFDAATTFVRIGAGSLGGKGRGLAFFNALLRRHRLGQRFPGVRVLVPRSAVLGTDVLEEFLDENGLRALAAQDVEDAKIAEAFVRAPLPASVRRDLKAFLGLVRCPLAVRSSSLLEDSLDQPFAGIYATHIIPNNHRELKVRFGQLCDAVKLVYASAFFREAKRYVEATGHHIEEEGMAVVVQELVGSRHEDHFYPTFSGVARSYNFYPTARMLPEEGVACVALGLGKIVVEGGRCLMFSPAHPHVLPQFATTEETLANAQREFFALDLTRSGMFPRAHADVHLVSLGLDAAERQGTLAPLGSVYSSENDVVYDGLNQPGPRLVTFAHVLKHDVFPLADILRVLLDVGREAMACPIEIEFAVDLNTEPKTFGCLQIRPILSDEELEYTPLRGVEPQRAVCFSPKTLGNGRIRGLTDILYVPPDRFDSARTEDIAAEIGRLNQQLADAGRHCILIGPGRWGTADRWLGIPVTWEQISSAKVIVETTLGDFLVASSQGAHFFQNLISLRVGYLAVNPAAQEGFIDWTWLAAQPAAGETRYLRHVRLRTPALVQLDGRTRHGAIFKLDHP